MPPAVHLIADLGAILIVARSKADGRVVILANPREPWRLIYGISRPVLWRHERLALVQALLA
jgi:hypothetical protein